MNPFEFKHFKLLHEKSPMQIGVDSMLLGSWANSTNARQILDIGTGCGILSVMTVQENRDCFITGIDISEKAIEEAEENRLNSPWPEQMKFEHADLKNYTPAVELDYIISNPPFFNQSSMQSPNEERAKARHDGALALEDIFTFAKKHLTKSGVLAMVLPYDEFEQVQLMACHHKMRFHRLTTVKPKEHKPANRILVEIGKVESKLHVDEIIIRRVTGEYTSEYTAITKDYYR